jgi:hypothetical protein
VRTLAAIVLLLAVFGASTQCVADCLTQQKTPPCHQHSQDKQDKKDSAPDSCKHAQPVADNQAVCPPAAKTPAPADTAFELFAPATQPADGSRLSPSVLRL